MQRSPRIPSPWRSTALRLAIGLSTGLTFAVAFGCSSSGGHDMGDGGSNIGGTSSVAGRGGSSGGATGGETTGGNPADGGRTGEQTGGRAGGSPSGGKASSGGSAGSGGSALGGQASSGAAGAPTGGDSGAPEVHYVGRVDTSDKTSARFAWSGTGAVVRFNGTSVAVKLSGGQEFTVVVDGTVKPKLTAQDGNNTLAEGLAPGEHTVELYRRTEANQGESAILGFDFGSGTLLAPPPVTRRLELIGDSITCGYGNEGANASCGFTPQTENHYLSYGAIAARNLQAELSTVAWSGKGVVCNYGDDAASCMDPMPIYFDRTLPNRADSTWDFSRFQPDAVVINLGTNDVSTSSDPDQATFEKAYEDLLGRVRDAYPNAHILCTNGPMLNGTDLATVRSYLKNVVTKLADPKITTFEIEPQDGSDGYGCDSHPSLARHQKVATIVTAALKAALGW